MSLQLEVDAVAGVLVVGVHGGLTGGELEPLRRCLARAIRGTRVVVMDRVAVGELDEHGLLLLWRRTPGWARGRRTL